MHSMDLCENNSNLNIRFFYGNTVCCGKARNLTAVDMIIHSGICYPVDSVFDILFLVNNKVIKIPVKVKGLLIKDHSSHTMAVEIASINSTYLDMLDSLAPEDIPMKLPDKTGEKVFA